MRPNASNLMVPKRLLQDMVLCLVQHGEVFFPHVLAVVRDMESDSSCQPISPMEGNPHKKCSVGFTIDMSVNLGNSSHFDVHNASQGLSARTEEIPDCGANWYFVLPYVHDLQVHRQGGTWRAIEGGTFEGLAIELGHGVAIRHRKSISQPDGRCGEKVGFDWKSSETSFLEHSPLQRKGSRGMESMVAGQQNGCFQCCQGSW